jgi:hypothetical protein
MGKHSHEIRCPIHVFVHLDSDERMVVDSRPFQRLRHIQQLAMTPMLYPAATHRRFEHSLGVMELAGRVFDVVTRADHLTDGIRGILPELSQPGKLEYWRRVVRMAALCHDVGHLPFSHAAEKELLPRGWTHERLSREIILGQEMRSVWSRMTPPLRAEDIEKLAVGKKEAPDLPFTIWEAILSEIIVGDSFGVDRMDYLLRDSFHTGVVYGRFDHFRLIDTLRILESPVGSDADGVAEPAEPTLGVEEGGLSSAEALLLGRYYMYSQVYFHAIRRIYDIHLKDFLTAWLPSATGEHTFPTDIGKHLDLTDNEVTAGILKAARDTTAPGHDPARRIVRHEHFKLLYHRHPADVKVNPDAGAAIYKSAREKFGADAVRHDQYPQKRSVKAFPVRRRDGRVVSAIEVSEVLKHIPGASFDFVFVRPDMLDPARIWLERERQNLIKPTGETK